MALIAMLLCVQAITASFALDCARNRTARCPMAAVMHCAHCDHDTVAPTVASNADQQATEAPAHRDFAPTATAARIVSKLVDTHVANTAIKSRVHTDTSSDCSMSMRV